MMADFLAEEILKNEKVEYGKGEYDDKSI